MRDQLKKAYIEAIESGNSEAAAEILFDCMQSQVDGSKTMEVLGREKPKEEPKGKKTDWARMVVYKDREGRELAVFEPTGGKDKRLVIRGVIMLSMKIQTHPQLPPQTQQQRFEFAFKRGCSVRHAMDTFDKVADDAVEKFKKEQADKAKQVLPARGNLLTGPDGKPLGMGKPRE